MPSQASTITRAIIETCAIFRCAPIEGTGSHRLKRFVLRATRMIPSTFEEGLTAHDEADFTLEQGEAYAIDVVVAAGDGKVRERLRDTWIKLKLGLRILHKKEGIKMVNAGFRDTILNGSDAKLPTEFIIKATFIETQPFFSFIYRQKNHHINRPSFNET